VCKAVLRAFTDEDLAQESNKRDYAPDPRQPLPQTFEDAVQHDPVATLCSLIRTVSDNMYLFPNWSLLQIQASSLHRQTFNEAIESVGSPRLQLLQDVDTCWSSTHLMIDHALDLKEVSECGYVSFV
jgi:hypothetical protein